MRYSGIIYNDITAAPGLCVSFFTQGCPHHCEGCHNPQTWDFEGGIEFKAEVLNELIQGLSADGIERSLCIMGGEPLCSNNEFLTLMVVKTVREKLPNTPIYIWSGYCYEELLQKGGHIKQILDMLMNSFSLSGHELLGEATIKALAEEACDEIKIDNMGTFLLTKRCNKF